MGENHFKPFWEEHGRRYRGEEFRFSETQISSQMMEMIIRYIKLAMLTMRMMDRYSERSDEARTFEPYFKDQPPG